MSAIDEFNEESFLLGLSRAEDVQLPELKQYSTAAHTAINNVKENIEKNVPQYQQFVLEFKQLLQVEFPENQLEYFDTFQKLIAQEVLEFSFDENTVNKILVGFTYHVGLLKNKSPQDIVLKLIRNRELSPLNLFNSLLDISDAETFNSVKNSEKGFLMLIEILTLPDAGTYATKFLNKSNLLEISIALKAIDNDNWSSQLFATLLLQKTQELALPTQEVLAQFTKELDQYSTAESLQINERIGALAEFNWEEISTEDVYQKMITTLTLTQQHLTTARPKENLIENVIKELRYNKVFLEDYEENRKDEIWTIQEPEEELAIKHDWIDIKEGDRIFVANAGIILLWPFLSTLFKNLNYLDKGLFKDRETQERAIHLIQYLVDGEEKTPEFILMLNKVICGVPIHEPIKINLKLTKEEKKEAEHFLITVKGQWKEMKNTSVEVFRDTFLKREGAINYEHNKWHLKVEQKPIDILLTKLPWGLAMIKFSWVKYRILVEWNAKN
jgi:hypothetical protein